MTIRFTLLFGLLMSMFYCALGQTQVKTIEFEELTREYRLHLPANYDSMQSYPLIFNLHGLGSNGFEQELYSEFSVIADSAGAILVYPEGTNNAWNAGFIVGGVDDAGFISALIDTLAGLYSVDLSRVYSTGMSNGGIMSHYLACSLDDRIAAIASVTGSMLTWQPATCNPQRPMPILQFHGTADETVPYYGGKGFLTVDSMMSFWAGLNNCATGPDSVDLPDLVAEGSTATYFEYRCSDSTEVAWYRLNGGGHTWPGATFLLPGDNTNQDIKASVLIWEFFQRHQHPNPRPAATTSLPEEWSERLTVYPNPFQGELIIQSSDFIHGEISITNMKGQEVFSQKLNGIGPFEINTSTWLPGVYLMTLKTSKGWYRQKVVKAF